MRLLAAVAVAGCGRLGFDAAADAGPRDADPACLTETFDTWDLTRWEMEMPLNAVAVAVANGRLELTPAPMLSGYNGLKLLSRPALTDTTFEVELVQATNAPSTELAIELEVSTQTRYVITADEGFVRFIEVNTTNEVSHPLDMVADRYWRISHDSATAQVRFQTGPDRMQWAATMSWRRRRARASPCTSTRVNTKAATRIRAPASSTTSA